MYWTYLRRELAGRAKQTAIVATGLAIAIALVIIVNSLAAGVRDAQTEALASVYGVGTDLTVTGAQAEPGQDGGGPRFDFGEDGGATADDGTTTLNQSRLETDRMRATLDASAVSTAAGTSGVSAVTGTLSLTNTTFSGELPQRPDTTGGTTDGTTGSDAAGGMGEPPAGGGAGGGFGGGSFGIDAVTVLGVEPGVTSVGPLSAVTVASGRALASDDAGTDVAVIDQTYATSNDLAVGDTTDLGGTAFEIVGIVASASDSADTAANVYIPLDVAQTLSGAGDVVSTLYVQADSAGGIDTVQTALEEALPDTTVSSQAELASTVSSSLASAGALITGLGTWLSVIVLIVAVALAVLFTISGVTRRTREIGTLKAIGWSDRRVVGQIAGETVAQSLLGGAIGVLLGIAGAVAITLIRPTVAATTTAESAGPGAGGGMPGGGMPGGGPGSAVAQAASDLVLSAPLSVGIILAALLLAVGGGVLAGAIGGWRAARLRPAEALRAVA